MTRVKAIVKKKQNWIKKPKKSIHLKTKEEKKSYGPRVMFRGNNKNNIIYKQKLT